MKRKGGRIDCFIDWRCLKLPMPSHTLPSRPPCSCIFSIMSYFEVGTLSVIGGHITGLILLILTHILGLFHSHCGHRISVLYVSFDVLIHILQGYAPLPQRPMAGRKLVGKRIFHFRPISSDIGRTHFNLSRKDGAAWYVTSRSVIGATGR